MSNRWDIKYANAELSDKPPEPTVELAVKSRAPGQALDLACGTGRHSLYLAAHGWEVTAVDYSSVALAILSERAAEGLPVHPVLADLEKDEYVIAPNAWDLIVDCCYLQRSLFLAIREGVKKGGLFVGVFPMSGINPEYLIKPGEARKVFEGWKLLHYEENERTEILAERP